MPFVFCFISEVVIFPIMCYKVLILFVITILLGNPFCWVLPNCPKNSMKCEIHLWIWGEFQRKNISFKKNWIKKENNHTNSNLTLNSFENISISLSWRVRELTKICQFIPFMILINYLFIFFFLLKLTMSSSIGHTFNAVLLCFRIHSNFIYW